MYAKKTTCIKQGHDTHVASPKRPSFDSLSKSSKPSDHFPARLDRCVWLFAHHVNITYSTWIVEKDRKSMPNVVAERIKQRRLLSSRKPIQLHKIETHQTFFDFFWYPKCQRKHYDNHLHFLKTPFSACSFHSPLVRFLLTWQLKPSMEFWNHWSLNKLQAPILQHICISLLS